MSKTIKKIKFYSNNAGRAGFVSPNRHIVAMRRFKTLFFFVRNTLVCTAVIIIKTHRRCNYFVRVLKCRIIIINIIYIRRRPAVIITLIRDGYSQLNTVTTRFIDRLCRTTIFNYINVRIIYAYGYASERVTYSKCQCRNIVTYAIVTTVIILYPYIL